MAVPNWLRGGELANEAKSGAHGADCVRGAGTDADFEELEETGVHRAIVGPRGQNWHKEELSWSGVPAERRAKRG